MGGFFAGCRTTSMKVLAAILVVLMGVLVALAAALALKGKGKGKNSLPGPAEDDTCDPPFESEIQENQRRHLRVTYPEGRRPKIQIRKHRLPVANVSEKGLCFLNTRGIKLGKWVRGAVTLHMGDTLVLEGQVVREQKGAIGLSLITPIPYKTILTEERLVSNRSGCQPLE